MNVRETLSPASCARLNPAAARASRIRDGSTATPDPRALGFTPITHRNVNLQLSDRVQRANGNERLSIAAPGGLGHASWSVKSGVKSTHGGGRLLSCLAAGIAVASQGSESGRILSVKQGAKQGSVLPKWQAARGDAPPSITSRQDPQN